MTWRVMVKNNKITGRQIDGKKASAVWAGEVMDGKPPIVSWRQDNSSIKAYTMFYCGKRVEEGRVVGTWYDTSGQSGDFEMVPRKE